MKLKTSRGIVTKLICCMALVVLTSVVAFSQTPKPKSGALLSIDGTAGSTAVSLKLYDSQIHSGSVKAVPDLTGTCSFASGDNIPTDAYVLQGGAPTGCDPGDDFEITDNNPNGTHQASGLKLETKFSGFHIETHYLSEPIVSITAATNNGDDTTTYNYTLTRGADLAANEKIVTSGMEAGNNSTPGTFTILSVVPGTSFTVNNTNGVTNATESGTGTVSNAVCNTSGTICANPDSGFLTVTNNTGSSFSGTISLTGTSTGCGPASDSFTGTLANSTGSVTLALGAPGTMASPTEIDSSNCGGFNQSQPLTLTPNVTSFAFFGGGPPAVGVCAPPCKDDYQFTPLNSASGDTLSVLPVPVPAGPLGSGTFGPFPTGCVGSGCTFQSGEFGSESPIDVSPLRFSATNFSNLACVPYADFSAAGNPVCVELKIDCINGESSCPDAASILYTVQNDYNIDANSLPNGVGGPAFIGEHAVDCPDTTFNLNIFTSYTAPSVTFDPLKGGGSGTPSCWVVAFDPSAAAVTTGNTVSTFTGFSGLFPPPTKNKVNPGASEPLNFTYKTSSGTPVTNLHWCTSIFNNTGGNCNGTNNNGAPKPWVAFGTLPIDCATGVGQPTFNETAAAGNSNLQNFGAGSYRFNLKTSKTATPGQCFVVVAQFDTGIAVYPDQFKYSK